MKFLSGLVFLALAVQTGLCFHAYLPDYDDDKDQSDGNSLVTEEYKQNLIHSTLNWSDSFADFLFSCIRRCKKGTDSDVVCGTDRNSYANVGQLFCAFSCGANVHLLQLSECPKDTTKPTPLSDDDIKTCMSRCPSEDRYGSPVCGTDNVTYENRVKLGCANLCGVDVSLKKPTAC